jgi:hypothetical protein
MTLTTKQYEALTPSERKALSEKHRTLTATGREDVLAALRAAAQAKGSPLSDAERAAVYDQFE